MRGIKSKVHKKRGVVLFCFLDEVFCVIRDYFAPVRSTLPEASEFWVGWRPWIFAFFAWPVVAQFHIFWHTGTNVFCNVERFLCIGATMPFAGHVGPIPCLFQIFTPPPPLLSLFFTLPVDRIRVPDETARIEH